MCDVKMEVTSLSQGNHIVPNIPLKNTRYSVNSVGNLLSPSDKVKSRSCRTSQTRQRSV